MLLYIVVRQLKWHWKYVDCCAALKHGGQALGGCRVKVVLMLQHPHVKRALVRTFQINRLFSELTVLEPVVLSVNERPGLSAHL